MNNVYNDICLSGLNDWKKTTKKMQNKKRFRIYFFIRLFVNICYLIYLIYLYQTGNDPAWSR